MNNLDQGTMTSTTLMDMLKTSVTETYPEIDVTGSGKVEILNAVMNARGWPAIIELGSRIQDYTWHPVLNAIVASSEPARVLDRWRRLERFGHTRNRTALVRSEFNNRRSLFLLRHTASDGGHIVRVNNLFVWGLLVGLMQAAGIEDVRASLYLSEREAFPIWEEGSVHAPSRTLPKVTHTLQLEGCAPPTATVVRDAETPNRDHQMTRDRLESLVANDLLADWTLEEGARELAMSTRSLQRALREEGTTFSRSVHQARVDAARELMRRPEMRLIDIAFCVGFSDQAHFTRIFRRLCDVPPSALREILLSPENKTMRES